MLSPDVLTLAAVIVAIMWIFAMLLYWIGWWSERHGHDL